MALPDRTVAGKLLNHSTQTRESLELQGIWSGKQDGTLMVQDIGKPNYPNGTPQTVLRTVFTGKYCKPDKNHRYHSRNLQWSVKFSCNWTEKEKNRFDLGGNPIKVDPDVTEEFIFEHSADGVFCKPGDFRPPLSTALGGFVVSFTTPRPDTPGLMALAGLDFLPG